MAIVLFGKTSCKLCDATIVETDDVVSLPHFITDPSSPFWEFSDSCVHRACFLHWPKAVEFRRLYDACAKEFQPRYPRTMQEDGTVTDDPNLKSYPSFF